MSAPSKKEKVSFHIFLRSQTVRSKFWWVLYIYMYNNLYFNNKYTYSFGRLVYLFVKQYCFTGHDFKRKWNYNPGQNMRQIVRKLNVDETRKIWYSILPKFWPLVPKIHFCWGDWTLVCSPRDFKIFLLFPTILSLKSFSNSWGNLYKNLIILEIKSRFTWDKSN